MSNVAYSALKAAWHTDLIDKMRNGEQVVPRQVHFIISDLCNHDCHFCSYRMSDGISSANFAEGDNHNPNRMIPQDKCKEILDDLAELGCKAVQFTGGGEPTVHPHHMEIFHYAQALGLETSLVTNGCLLRKGWESVLPKMKWIRVSVDAGTPDTYAHVRRVKKGMFFRALNNLKALKEQIDKQATDTLLGAGYVVTRENWQEIAQGCRLLKDTGVPYVRLAGMFSTAGSRYYKGLYDPICTSIRKARESYESESFKIVDLFGHRIGDLDQGAPDYSFCGYQQFCTYIGGNQKVYRCCSTSYTDHGEVGDLRRQSFKEWFLSDQKKEAYAGFDARSCSVCQFNDKNRTINYMLDGAPMHVNFV